MFKKRFFNRIAVALVLSLAPVVAFAQRVQAGTADEILSNTQGTLENIASLVINLVSIIMGLVAAAMLGVNLYKYFKGDPSSNDALIKVGGGLLIAVIILQIIRVTLLGNI